MVCPLQAWNLGFTTHQISLALWGMLPHPSPSFLRLHSIRHLCFWHFDSRFAWSFKSQRLPVGSLWRFQWFTYQFHQLSRQLEIRFFGCGSRRVQVCSLLCSTLRLWLFLILRQVKQIWTLQRVFQVWFLVRRGCCCQFPLVLSPSHHCVKPLIRQQQPACSAKMH